MRAGYVPGIMIYSMHIIVIIFDNDYINCIYHNLDHIIHNIIHRSQSCILYQYSNSNIMHSISTNIITNFLILLNNLFSFYLNHCQSSRLSMHSPRWHEELQEPPCTDGNRFHQIVPGSYTLSLLVCFSVLLVYHEMHRLFIRVLRCNIVFRLSNDVI
jgi:hypothetical protein